MSRFQIIDELHRSARKNFPRRSVIIKGIDDLWQMDLVELIPYSTVNRGYRYLLTVIDSFSKFAWVRAVKNKSGIEIVRVLKNIFRQSQRVPKNLQTDHGKEFYNKDFEKLMKSQKINHYSSFTHLKASIVERFNRTLKQKMWKMFTLNGNYKWVDNLDGLVETYNNSIHRTIKMKPIEVNRKNEKTLLLKVFNRASRPLMKNKLKIGDYVRISKYKTIFAKGYTPNWTTEIFRITHINRKKPVTYLIEDGNKKSIAGRFYEQELLKVKYPNIYLVERVLRRKGNMVYVKWLGFDNTHNSWIEKKNLI